MEMFSKLTAEDEQTDGFPSLAPGLRRIDISTLLPEFKSTLVGLRNGLSVASISVLISALVLAFSKEGLTVYHGLVTLNLAQLNSLSSLLIWFVIAFTHQSPEMDFFTVMINDMTSDSGLDSGSVSSSNLMTDTNSTTSRTGDIEAAIRNLFKQILSGAVHFVVHASLAGGFGLWFWSDQSRFERYAEDSECIAQTMYWFFVPLNSHNKHIRRFFLAYNSLLVFPLTAPIAITLLSVAVMIAAIPLIPLTIWGALGPPPWPTISLVAFIAGLGGGAYVLPMAFYIYSTEQTIRLNVLLDDEEGSWSYGQTLALITASMSVAMLGWDIVKFVWVLVRSPSKVENVEAKDESGVLDKSQEIGPSSSAVSLRDAGVQTIRRTGTDAASL
ncbi:hypothetical protein VNI00_006211 [Paramarasmius palmivorus]|uniref:Uncharacterized protein n=1 Tax=Paramarasmius palmivorus TaxID=297713 RepID=A0AAW0D988_9AGAR